MDNSLSPYRMQMSSYQISTSRSRLLDAALVVLQRVGPRKLSLREIAVHAGVAPSTVYHHFNDKEAFLGVLASFGFNKLREAMAREIRDETEKPKKLQHSFLRRALLAYIAFAQEHAQLYRLMYEIHDRGDVDEVISAECLAFAELAGALIADGQGHYPKEIMEDCSIALWSAGRGIAAISLKASSTIDETAETIDRAVRGLQFLGSLPRNELKAKTPKNKVPLVAA